MRIIAVLVMLLACISVAPAVSGASGFPTYNPPDPSRVDFVAKCFWTKYATVDPIVAPGVNPFGHNHTFGANPGINQNSTAWTLGNGGAGTTNCGMKRDRAAYWMPTAYNNNGNAVKPTEVRAYYRAGTTNTASVRPIPFGLVIIAGDAKATSPQSAGRAGWQCRNLTSGNTVSKQALPPTCPTGDFMESSVVFPNCWNGRNLDSVDHKSHMAYAAATAACPSSHPVRLPQLTLAYRFPTNALNGATMSLATVPLPGETAAQTKTRSRMTLHADFMNAWDPATMAALVEHCIHRNVGCEDISNTRLPPSMNGTLPTDTTPPTTAAPAQAARMRSLRSYCKIGT